ncbi:VWA domain-containing protein [Thalassorhabdomicrobium marinisediminis]|uniref:VWFA domain-containing protein n=1 Tax=Thalassorhabdomicrobium marinisediminis TaxID=2170577 RepID=A0A2T7FW74_9RHOB|nr:VWA domain-containing protein [Thalassorhabdomicrobium marinisediminis]PVA06411.1 hypothetical protein DC363_10945 [Thalassorhabdomicrobium marinisediminis]
MRPRTSIIHAATLVGGLGCGLAAQAQENVVIVYDGSGSMWGQIDGTSKVEIAREVLADLVTGWDDGAHLGLVAYGHRTEGDCTDIETMIAPGPVDRDSFIATVNAINPVGKTPITASVRHAADLLSYRDAPATVVLISDGVETCNADPCALAAQLEQEGVAFTAHVVGFDLDDAANASLACIADNTGGMFVPASNAAELTDALAQVQEAMVQPPEPEPEPETPAAPPVTLTAPAQVVNGAVFDIAWSETLDALDFLTIVPMGADRGTVGNHIRAREATEGQLTAPGTPGLYELRYVPEDSRETLASVQIEVIEAEVTLTAPAQVTTGATFDIGWSNTINPLDFLTIVPMGSDAGTVGNHIRARDASEGQLTAPGTPGLYELRYVLEEGRRTVASVQIEVSETEVTLTAPAQVTTGATFDITWSNTINPLDFLTIVPMGSDAGTVGNHIRARDASEGRLTAPGTPGLYELRYVLEEGRNTQASVQIEVVAAEVTVTAPAQVTTGAVFDIGWSETINPLDFLTIVPKGADAGTVGNHIRAREASAGRLTAPGTPGFYELRYVQEEGRNTLASARIEVVEAEIGISGPGTVRAGTAVDVTWSSSVNDVDFVTIVPMGADEGAVGAHIRTRGNTEGRLTAPEDAGMYELRYVLEEGRRTLASAPLEVVGADAPLDSGAGLSVPETAAPGEVVTVSWTLENDGSDRRVALARKDQPDFSWISVQPVGEGTSAQITVPDEAGVYEIRFLDISGGVLLGRAVINVQ